MLSTTPLTPAAPDPLALTPYAFSETEKPCTLRSTPTMLPSPTSSLVKISLSCGVGEACNVRWTAIHRPVKTTHSRN
ncbi:hypothetical protein A0H81_03470 [Grifola frondosa]|uniref:Uncharacterized protein n=1 Tax=Grifola frondosa TaxID=5627 RepID=A0A1C7MJ01_GRIFR|nr:hypothetical protein A0H81_03470 [Grifola frondosa]